MWLNAFHFKEGNRVYSRQMALPEVYLGNSKLLPGCIRQTNSLMGALSLAEIYFCTFDLREMGTREAGKMLDFLIVY